MHVHPEPILSTRRRSFSVSYSAADIKTLDPVDHIRIRVGNALGNNPLETAVREVVDNALDEVVGGHADNGDNCPARRRLRIEITDDGRGIPADYDEHKEQRNGVVKAVCTFMSRSEIR
jgi:DNA gyrase subunit B